MRELARKRRERKVAAARMRLGVLEREVHVAVPALQTREVKDGREWERRSRGLPNGGVVRMVATPSRRNARMDLSSLLRKGE